MGTSRSAYHRPAPRRGVLWSRSTVTTRETPQTVRAAGNGRAYEIVAQIGRGGFGSVYKARALGAAGFEKVVAIKLLHADAEAVPEMARRMRDEARMLGLLHHRAIVQVDDLVEVGGRWAVVMEYIDGVDLGALMSLGPIPARPVCEIAREVAAALEAAHEALAPGSGRPMALVHRDVKPANIRVTARGEVKVLDFGVSRATFAAREAVTHSLSFGSPGYMAPERYDGVETSAVDVFALGVVMLECLLGVAVGALSVHPGRFEETKLGFFARLTGVPDALTQILDRMLAYEAGVRPTAAEVARALQEIAAQAPGAWLSVWAPGAVAAAHADALLLMPPPDDGAGLSPGTRLEAHTAASTIVASPRANAGLPRWAIGAAIGVALAVAGAYGAVLLRPAEPRSGGILARPVNVRPPEAIAAPPPPTPAPAADPTPSKPRVVAEKRAASARVAVEGDADSVRLVDERGHVAEPGDRVPPGRWRVRASFGGVTVDVPTVIDLVDGATARVRCVKAVENCTVSL